MIISCPRWSSKLRAAAASCPFPVNRCFRRKSRRNIALRTQLRKLVSSAIAAALVFAGQTTIPAAAAGTTTPPAAQVPSATTIEGVTEIKLPNGFRVVTVEDHSYPVAACYLWYRVGSRNEQSGLTGLSHVVEHLLFEDV